MIVAMPGTAYRSMRTYGQAAAVASQTVHSSEEVHAAWLRIEDAAGCEVHGEHVLALSRLAHAMNRSLIDLASAIARVAVS